MSFESFALASRSISGLEEDDASLMYKAGIASFFSDALANRFKDIKDRLLGAGLCRDGSRIQPTILADRSQLHSDAIDPVPLDGEPRVRELLAVILDGWPEDFDAELRVIGVKDGFQQANPGDRLTGTRMGRMGPHVRWGAGREGFLTAGHVAPGGPVDDSGGATLGSVLWANDPAAGPSTAADVDVALVEFASSLSAGGRMIAYSAAVGDTLTAAVTGSSSDVLGFFEAVQLGAAGAVYSKCYTTETMFTANGDSGGLVENGGRVVGMVIGGYSRRDMTLVQSIGYQLGEIRTRSGHMVTL